jgi:hypothetical protein
MKVIVRIDSQQYEVEIADLYARPVIATVDGQRFEVWPEIGTPPAAARLEIVSGLPKAGRPVMMSLVSNFRPTTVKRSN